MQIVTNEWWAAYMSRRAYEPVTPPRVVGSPFSSCSRVWRWRASRGPGLPNFEPMVGQKMSA